MPRYRSFSGWTASAIVDLVERRDGIGCGPKSATRESKVLDYACLAAPSAPILRSRIQRARWPKPKCRGHRDRSRD
jgi:hypothetical protein